MKHGAVRLGHGTGKKFTSAGGSGWRLCLLLTGLLVIAAADPAAARPSPFDALPIIEIPLEPEDRRRGGSALSWHRAFDDTVLYGGTVWSPDSMRWEALRDSHWTFDTGVGSSINTGGNPNKPIGYHQTMEGWFGIDQTLNPQPYFRRSSTCAISGSFSLWAGVTVGEATNLCYSAGQGYGDDWDLSVAKDFEYGGLGSVEVAFDYSVDAEPTFDFAYVQIDTTGIGAAPDIVLWARDGLASGFESVSLVPGVDMRSTAGPFRVRFRAYTDGGYSDQDGLYASVCGLAAFDNVIVGTDTTDFEFGLNGWAQEFPAASVGDFSHLADLASLPAPTTFCPCGHADSVLVFFDESAGNPLDQDNIAVSPWIDLLAGGDVGRPGKLLLYDIYSEMPLANYIFVQLRTRYYPQVCAVTGQLRMSDFLDQNVIFYFGELPFCNPTDAPRIRDYSSVLPPSAEQVQVAWGVLSLCRTSPFGPLCTGVSNTTPWIDNASLGVYGFPNAPILTVSPSGRFHDNFASDGTLYPPAPGRIDIASVKGASSPVTGSRLGDTLIASAAGGNVEVRLVFRVHAGPFISTSALAGASSRWTEEPGPSAAYGGSWYSARMDTAEQGGVVPGSGSRWMSTHHESDPGFAGTDQSLDPSDPGRLANDILPDNVLPAGSRVDYFIAARYVPPDPRNPGGAFWAVAPDTAGGSFYEAEILPSSFAPDTTWNCVLYVDHHDDRDFAEQRIEESALQQTLGPGSHNLEKTRYDRYDVLSPGASTVSLGRPLDSEYGVSLVQVFAYTRIVWHSASLSSMAFTREDANVIGAWFEPDYHFRGASFWGTGSGLAQSMHEAGVSARSFLNHRLGVVLNCTSIRLVDCPIGTLVDTTACLPTVSAPAPHFVSTVAPFISGNGCPSLQSFDVLSPNPNVSGVAGQLSYMKLGAQQSFASISREATSPFVPDPYRLRSVLDGFSLGRIRGGDAPDSWACNVLVAAYARQYDVFQWFDHSVECPIPRMSSVADPDVPLEPRHVPRLGPAHPNPTPGAARLSFVNAAPNARVRLDILDVSGRLVRTLVNGPLAAGPHELTWDGRAADGRLVADGLYFYRMTTDGFTEAKKLVVLR